MQKKWGWIILLILIISLASCEMIYGILYTEFTITVVNKTSQDITGISISVISHIILNQPAMNLSL